MMIAVTAPASHCRLRRSALASIGVAAAGLAVFAFAIGERLALSTLYVPKTLAVFGLGMALLLAHLPAHRPLQRFGSANQATLARAVLVALAAGLVGEGHAPLGAFAAAVGLLSLALDGVDGWLARRNGLASPFGARFDMETDAALVMVLATLTWQLHKAGAWVLLAGLLRYAFVAAGWAVPWLRRRLAPSRRRQTVCVVQILALAAALVPAVAPPWSAIVAAAGLLALCYSFAADTRSLYRHARPPLAHERPI